MNEIGTHIEDWNDCFVLTNDIDMAGIGGDQFNIIGYYNDVNDYNAFTGVFDGNGHSISNFTYQDNDTYKVGIFGYVGDLNDANAVIKDLTLIDPNVRGGNNIVGALVGELANGTVTNCSVHGGTCVAGEVGGLVGQNGFGDISNCYSISTILFGNAAGGLVGINDMGNISNCYSISSVLGLEIGGLVGINFEGKISNCYTEGLVDGLQNVGGLVGSNIYSGGNISNCYATGRVSGICYTGGLVGNNFEGNISNCYTEGPVDGNDIIGGLVGANIGGSISSSCSITSISGKLVVGGLVGGNQGIISACYAAGDVVGNNVVGGLLGDNSGNTSNCYATSSVNGNDSVGGLAGANFYGLETLGTISNCYAAGPVVGDSNVGGFLGWHRQLTPGSPYTINFWDIEVNPDMNGIGNVENDPDIIGKTTSEMQTRDTFISVGWDFVGEMINGPNEIWRMCVDDVNYPLLSWQFNKADFVCPDGVDSRDFAILAAQWLDSLGTPSADIAPVGMPDGIIDWLDLEIFTDNWLVGK
jgi:hypothetical protein